MGALTKINNGLLFEDDFKEKTLMWTLSPSDGTNLSFGDTGLQIKHSKDYTSYTISEPVVDEYACIVQLVHVPQNENDIAGVIVLNTTKEYAECQSFMASSLSQLNNKDTYDKEFVNDVINSILDRDYVEYSIDNGRTIEENDTNSETEDTVEDFEDAGKDFVDTLYKYIKFYKMKYKYIFYASPDGYTWIEVGNVKFTDSNVIGLFLHETDNPDVIENSHCYFNNFTVYKGKYITIEGISRLHEFELVDNAGKILLRTDNIEYAYMISRVNKTTVINTTTLPVPIINGRIRVFEKNKYEETIADYELGNLYGGDTFNITDNIKLYINNNEVDPLELYDLGTFYNGSYYIEFRVHNHEEYRLTNVKVKVICYSEYYSGEEEMSIALYDENKFQEELEYKKEIIIDEINPSEGRILYMKLTDYPVQDYYLTANSYRFKIVIE